MYCILLYLYRRRTDHMVPHTQRIVNLCSDITMTVYSLWWESLHNLILSNSFVSTDKFVAVINKTLRESKLLLWSNKAQKLKFICILIVNALHAGSTKLASYSKKARVFIFTFYNVNGMEIQIFIMHCKFFRTTWQYYCAFIHIHVHVGLLVVLFLFILQIFFLLKNLLLYQ